MTGTNPDAIEAWAFDAETFEHLLKRLEPYGRVVLLSGDVHYSSGTVMSYWKGNATQPARFAQFTSSGFKNVMPTFITFIDKSLGFAQQLIRANLGTERLGWDQPHDDMVLYPPGVQEGDLTPVMRSRLISTPVRLPTWGWPDKNDPDSELRPDQSEPPKPGDVRPTGAGVSSHCSINVRTKSVLQASSCSNSTRPSRRNCPRRPPCSKAFRPSPPAISTHSSDCRNARQILFRGNVGLVRFEREDQKITAVHEVYTSFSDPTQPTPQITKPEAFLVQVASLGPEPEDRPERLREKAIEIPPSGAA